MVVVEGGAEGRGSVGQRSKEGTDVAGKAAAPAKLFVVWRSRRRRRATRRAGGQVG